MVMWFNVKEAREQLLKDQVVYSLRPKRRKREGHEILMFNGFGKKGDLNVEFLMEVEKDSDIPEICVEMSGFSSMEDWRKAAKDGRFLYRVELLSLADKQTEDPK